MFTANTANWVTFEDESQSPQRSRENDNVCRPNGLKLTLPKMQDFSNQLSSITSTSLSSPKSDYFYSPDPPSNSPLCTPTRDYPVSPCFPKSGTHFLSPIPELSSNVNHLPLIEPPSQKLTGISQPVHSSKFSTLKPIHGAQVMHQENSKKLENSLDSQAFFQNVSSESAFSNPFWSEDSSTGSLSSFHVHEKESDFERDCSFKGKKSWPDQKSLNQGSFNYICERLEHLKTETSNNERTLRPIPCICTRDGLSSFIPSSLFSSQRKDGWPFMLRIPEKKNMMSSRQWGPIYLRILPGGILQMYYEKGLEKPFKEFQLHPFCRLSEPKLENCSISGKIHTVKIEYVTYIEKKKYPKTEVVHEAEIEQMLKLGTTDYDDFTDFLMIVEEELMKLPAISKSKRHYEEQEMILEIVDNFWGTISKSEDRLTETAVITHIYSLNFLNGNSECFMALNDLELEKRNEHYFESDNKKKLIKINNYHFHQCVKKQEFEQSRIIKFTPPDGCRVELMRYRTQYNGSDLPFSIKALLVVQGAYVELQAFINVSSAYSYPTKHCENVMVHFPVPSQWNKTLWTMNLQRQRSLKAKMNRRTCLGSLNELESDSIIHVSVGTAKYESAYRAIVWKIDRLPDKNANPDHLQSLSFKLELGSDQEIPSDWCPFAVVQFVVSDACASETEVKSWGIDRDVQPQKHVIQKACYNCQVEIEKKWIRLEGEDPSKSGDCDIQ